MDGLTSKYTGGEYRARDAFAQQFLGQGRGVISVRVRGQEQGEPYLLVGLGPEANLSDLPTVFMGVRVSATIVTREPRHLLAPIGCDAPGRDT
jgi:hypothetical protein